ncbi:MAG: DNA-directed RNA polymerase subunit alpha C-terminal domain-containing protein [Flavobacteriales bacterium]
MKPSISTEEKDFEHKIALPSGLRDVKLEALNLPSETKRKLLNLEIDDLQDLDGVYLSDLTNFEDFTSEDFNSLERSVEEYVNSNNTTEVSSDFGSPKDIFRIPEDLFETSVDSLSIPLVIKNVLKSVGINSLKDLDGCKEEELLQLRNFGDKSLSKLREAIEEKVKGSSQTYEINLLEKVSREGGKNLYIPFVLRDKEISISPLDTRVKRALVKSGKKVFRDLKNLNESQLLQINNFGEKSLEKLQNYLQDVRKKPSQITKPLFSKIIDTLESNSERNVEILRERIIEKRTLEEIGDNFNITRQRVEQIESDFKKEVKNRFSKQLSKVRGLIKEQALKKLHPLGNEEVRGLFGEKIWDSDNSLDNQLKILTALFPGTEYFLSISEGTQTEEIESTEDKILSELKFCVEPIRPKRFYEKKLSNSTVSKEQFIKVIDTSRRIKINYQNGEFTIRPKKIQHKHWIKKLLRDSEKPLTEDELINKYNSLYSELYGEIDTDRVMGNAENWDGVFLLSSHTYGLEKHFEIPPSKRNEYLDFIYQKIKREEEPGFMLNARYTSEWISEEFGEEVNGYEMSVHLRKDERFEYLGRMIYTLSEWEVDDRQELDEIILQAFEEKGQPLHRKEILEYIRKMRSVKSYTLQGVIEGSEEIYKYENGFFGTKPRDEMSLGEEFELKKRKTEFMKNS